MNAQINLTIREPRNADRYVEAVVWPYYPPWSGSYHADAFSRPGRGPGTIRIAVPPRLLTEIDGVRARHAAIASLRCLFVNQSTLLRVRAVHSLWAPHLAPPSCRLAQRAVIPRHLRQAPDTAPFTQPDRGTAGE